MTTAPSLALTFDDHYVDEWLSASDIFKAHDVRATFYVTGFPNVPSMGVLKLHKLLDRGHEIGFHSVSHLNAVETSKTQGIDGYIQSEIFPGLEGMKLLGFNPTSFAYPYNAHNDELDKALKPYFTTMRARAETLEDALQWKIRKPILKARSCDTVRADGATLKSADDVVSDLRAAAQKGLSIALYGHGISDQPINHHHMTLRGLDYVLWSAKQLGFQFVTASELISADQ